MKNNLKKVMTGLLAMLMLLTGGMTALATDGLNLMLPSNDPFVTADVPPAEEEVTVTTTTETTVEDQPAEEKPAGKQSFIVSLFDADGFLFLSMQVDEGKKMMDPQGGPAPEGYKFSFWYDVLSEEVEPFDFETPITSNMEIWAYIEALPAEEKDAEGVEATGGNEEITDDNTGEQIQDDTTTPGGEGQENEKPDNNVDIFVDDTDSGLFIIDNEKVDGLIGAENKQAGEEEEVTEETEVTEEVTEETEVKEEVTEETEVTEEVTEETEVKEEVTEETEVTEEVTEETEVKEEVTEETEVTEEVTEETETTNENTESSEDIKVVETEPLPERRIVIRSDISALVRMGDTITMTGELIGYDDLEYTLQWQMNDGNGWVDVPGATEISYSFTVTEETMQFGWRLQVNIIEETQEPVVADEVAEEPEVTDAGL